MKIQESTAQFKIQTLSEIKYLWQIFLSVKFATSLLASLAGGIKQKIWLTISKKVAVVFVTDSKIHILFSFMQKQLMFTSVKQRKCTKYNCCIKI